jgi:hypothetical protein
MRTARYGFAGSLIPQYQFVVIACGCNEIAMRSNSRYWSIVHHGVLFL